MTKRLNILARKNGGIEGLVAVEAWIAKSFDPTLMELVKVRGSQINGCANCLHMHRQDALKLGETEERMLLLNAWHESELYTDRERAALTWAEALTFTAAEIEAKLSSARIISAASFVTSVPLMPIATPISAFFSAGASLTPSPVMATI